MKKRVLSMLMTLALCLTLFPAPAWATEDAPEGGAIVQQEQQEEQQDDEPDPAFFVFITGHSVSSCLFIG